MGGVIGVKELVLIVGILLLAGLLPIPAAFGSFELSQAFVFGALELGTSMGVAMVIILRVFDLGLALLGLLVILHKLALRSGIWRKIKVGR